MIHALRSARRSFETDCEYITECLWKKSLTKPRCISYPWWCQRRFVYAEEERPEGSHGVAPIDDSAAHHAGLDAKRSGRHHRGFALVPENDIDAHRSADRDSPDRRRHREGKPRRRSVRSVGVIWRSSAGRRTELYHAWPHQRIGIVCSQQFGLERDVKGSRNLTLGVPNTGVLQ